MFEVSQLLGEGHLEVLLHGKFALETGGDYPESEAFLKEGLVAMLFTQAENSFAVSDRKGFDRSRQV